MARAVTPLELVGLNISDCALVAFSARAKHRDLDLALREARVNYSSPIAVLTMRPPGPSEIRARPPVEFIGLPEVATDGFLATNSILLMAGLVAKAHLQIRRDQLVDDLPSLHEPWSTFAPPRPLSIVLYAPPTAAVAVDLEARMSETGLTQTQLADYRNFSHGRHRGFNSMSQRCSIIAIMHPSNRVLIDETLSHLPQNSHLIRLNTDLSGVSGVLDLLVASMKLTEASSKAHHLEAGRSDVPDFGRRLYHLNSTELVHCESIKPVAMKMSAAGIVSPGSEVVRAYNRAYDKWRKRMESELLAGLLLDYDGTCNYTNDRDAPPPASVQVGVNRLLAEGIPVAFASGRGKSLLAALRVWILQEHWSSVRLSLYNGAYRIRMSQQPEGLQRPADAIALACDRIAAEPYGNQLLLEQRASQLTVSPLPHNAINLKRLGQSITELLLRPPVIPLRVGLSAHSIDIVIETSSKETLLREVEQSALGPVLAIGDQGALDGNDFQLLSCTPFSLTVDTCSGDTTRCWRLPGGDLSGPDLLGNYLERLEIKGSRFSITTD